MRVRLGGQVGSAVIAAATLSALLTACGGQSDPPAASDEQLAEEVFDALGRRAAMSSRVGIMESLSDALPTQKVTIDGAKAKRVAVGIVTGEVVGVEPYGAWKIEADPDDPDGTPVPFDSDEADWRTATVSVRVDRAWGVTLANHPAVLDFTLPVVGPATPDDFMTGVRGLGQVIVVLNPSILPGTDEPYSAALGGSALGQVDASGAITFPAMREEAAAFVGDLRSVKAVDEAADRPQPVIVVENGVVISE